MTLPCFGIWAVKKKMLQVAGRLLVDLRLLVANLSVMLKLGGCFFFSIRIGRAFIAIVFIDMTQFGKFNKRLKSTLHQKSRPKKKKIVKKYAQHTNA